ncbi:MAG: hypothetical protein IT488_04180 [Gammaproteobacteria bacterium]|nr:hypothetical protein [Gammaproteobacteria bacterium]
MDKIELLPDANELLKDIDNFKKQAEAAALAAEEANRKANSESGYAFNAKQVSEDHARAISQIKGTVESDSASITAKKKNVDEFVQAIEASKVAAETGAKVATDTKSSIEKDAASIKASNERISAILSAIEKIHADISTALKEVTEPPRESWRPVG